MVFAQKKQALRPHIVGSKAMTPGSKLRTSINILFVCTANICRSFLAERILKKILQVKKIHYVEGYSAGLMDLQGAPADFKAARLLHERGMDGIRHCSRPLTEDLVDWADVILVMEEIHKEVIFARYPETRDKVHLLGAFSGCGSDGDKNIKDPHGLTDYHYRTCFAEIYLALDGLIKCI
jgi:protein-tyrosine-phosphatase